MSRKSEPEARAEVCKGDLVSWSEADTYYDGGTVIGVVGATAEIIFPGLVNHWFVNVNNLTVTGRSQHA